MFEVLFKYPQEVFERGELVFAPLFGGLRTGMVIASLLLLAAVLVISTFLLGRMDGLGAGRKLLLAGLQATFAAGVLVLLAQPALELATIAPGANSVAVLVDVSESMGFEAGGDRGSRLDAARAAIDQTLLPSVAAVGEVATFVFGRHARRHALTELAADAPDTHLVASLEDVVSSFRGAPLAAVVLVSDGADNGPRHDLTALQAAGVPVHSVGVGPSELAGEALIGDVSLPADAPPASRVVADVEIRHSTGGPAAVKVFDGSRLVAVGEIELRPETPVQRLPVAFDSGPGGIRELTFVIEPPAGDHLGDNNRVQRLLAVNERQRRVLYLEGEPRWEYKFIRRAVGGDDVLRLTSWLRTTDRKSYRQDVRDAEELSHGFPASKAELYRYDVLVLGSLSATYLTEQQHQWLEAFVGERGGSLLALGGRDALGDGGWDVVPLAQALPVKLLRGNAPGYGSVEGAVRLTPEGARSPVVQLVDVEGGDPWASLPPLGDHQRLGALKPAATVLLEIAIDDQTRPLLVTQPYGLGSAAVLATASTWRWQMRTPADDERHTLFWRQLLRQLGESARQPRELRFAVQDDEILVRLEERNDVFEPRRDVRAHATVTGPGADAERVDLAATEQPGALLGRYRPSGAGVYRVDVQVEGDPSAVTRFIRLGGERTEHFQPTRNEALLRRIADSTGGRYWSLDQIGGIAETLTFASAGVKRIERFPLWDVPAAFLLLLALKSGEWLLRRRWGRI